MSAAGAVGTDLKTLAERLWTPVGDPDWPVTVSFDPPPPGHVIAEEYIVVPDLRRPKFLVPVAARSASRAAFSRYLTTSSLRTRALGYVSAAGFGSPVGERVMGARLFVGINSAIPRDEWSRWLLLRHLEEVLGATDLVAYLPVRRAVPNAKPTLRLFERGGRPMGYVKVGWSLATRAVVRNEAAALAAVQNRLRLLRAPQLSASGVWQGNEYAVAAPLPKGVRSYTEEPSTTPQLLLDIAQSGDVSRGPLVDSSFARRVHGDLALASANQPEASEVLLQWLQRLEARPHELDFGRWHGDFVPWNLGRTAAGPVAWDWEYSDPDVPVGFDLVHWHFQHRLSPADGTLVAAMRVADEQAPRLTSLGVAPGSTGQVTSLYLLDMFTRSVRMAAAGAGWNAKFYPAMLDLARTRDV